MTDPNVTQWLEVHTPGRYRLDPDRSRVHYSGKHMFGMGTVQATFMVQEGELRIDRHVATSEVTVVVAAASFTSHNAKRDKDVRSASLLDVDTYPDITFRSDGLQATADGWLVRGTVTAHGHTVPVDLRIDRITPEGTGIRVQARAEHLDRTAFGITGARGMVGRYLDLEVDAFASAE